MSRTLFRYILWDLVKVFGMASGALAGIMSFGGLLRPLTQHGLDGGQVWKILSYLMPAMSTYSLPIAALFATTVVYGRLSADNEILACRASGISHLAIALPGLLLGLLLSIMSLGFLCFIVPSATLGVEKVIYSNLAKIIASEIERSHQTDKFGQFTVFAQKATVVPPDPARPTEQVVILTGPMIVPYTKSDAKRDIRRVPREFYTARQATLYIRPNSDGSQFMMEAVLAGGMKFPRQGAGGDEAGIEATQFGPFPLQSGLREKTKFMDIFQLKDLDQDPVRSREVNRIVADFIREEQVAAFINTLSKAFQSESHTATFNSGGNTYQLVRGEATVTIDGPTIRLQTSPEFRSQTVRLLEKQADRFTLTADAREARIHVRADSDAHRMIVSTELFDTIIDTGDAPTPRSSFPKAFSLPMTPDLLALESRSVQEYLTDPIHLRKQQDRLAWSLLDLTNHIRSEMHARVSFSISCLILVMIGCALGMMFKSGNFLSAFAVSVVPAVLTVVLIVSGQHVAESTPLDLTQPSPLQAGLYVIWSGNALVLALATGLLWRLQRQ